MSQLGGACVRSDCQDALTHYYHEMGAPITADRKTIDKIIAGLRLANKVDVHIVTPEEATGYIKAGTMVYIMMRADGSFSRISTADAVQMCHNREKQRVDDARLTNQLMARDKYKSKAKTASLDRLGLTGSGGARSAVPPSVNGSSSALRGASAGASSALSGSATTGGSTAFEVYQKAMAEFGNRDFGQFGFPNSEAAGLNAYSQPPFGLHGRDSPLKIRARVLISFPFICRLTVVFLW